MSYFMIHLKEKLFYKLKSEQYQWDIVADKS